MDKATTDDGLAELQEIIMRVKNAQSKFASYSQEQVDSISKPQLLRQIVPEFHLPKWLWKKLEWELWKIKS